MTRIEHAGPSGRGQRRVADDDVARAGVANDGRRHAADRAGAGDEHVFAECREGERGVHCVSERIEDRRNVLVYPRPVVPDVRHRQRYVLGERAGPLYPEPDGVRTQVPAPCHAVPAATADDVPLAADEVADLEVAHVGADRGRLTDELVADNHRHGNRLLRPGIPAVDVQIGAADPGLPDPDQDVVHTDLRVGYVLEPEAFGGLGFNQRTHALGTLHSPPAARSGGVEVLTDVVRAGFANGRGWDRTSDPSRVKRVLSR